MRDVSGGTAPSGCSGTAPACARSPRRARRRPTPAWCSARLAARYRSAKRSNPRLLECPAVLGPRFRSHARRCTRVRRTHGDGESNQRRARMSSLDSDLGHGSVTIGAWPFTHVVVWRRRFLSRLQSRSCFYMRKSQR